MPSHALARAGVFARAVAVGGMGIHLSRGNAHGRRARGTAAVQTRGGEPNPYGAWCRVCRRRARHAVMVRRRPSLASRTALATVAVAVVAVLITGVVALQL